MNRNQQRNSVDSFSVAPRRPQPKKNNDRKIQPKAANLPGIVLPPKPPKTVEVSFNLTMPKMLKLPHLPRVSRRQLWYGVVGLAILVVFFTAAIVIRARHKEPLAQTQHSQDPQFATISPDGKKEPASSGKLTYDPERKVASFTDKIGTVDVTVSQQALPENFKTEPEAKVQELAKSFGATEVIAESNPRAYLGISAQGLQTAIFHKNDLLIFIYARRKIDKSDWAAYITKLQ